MTSPSCRLFVIRAFDAPAAVIIRRGPSKWFHLILWDMDRDVFTEGAWFHGRIYEDMCDLSPDGKLFVYAALRAIDLDSRPVLTWTALSRPPFVTPLAIWPRLTTNELGGRFYGNRRLALRGSERDAYPEVPKGLELISGNTEPHHSTGEAPGADWCGYDRLNRTIYTIGGKLFRQDGGRDILLADFTDLRPDPQPPPEWATRPL
jgi:hypothetical protein